MRLVLLILGVVSLVNASAQEWPVKTVRIIVPFPGGGSADLLPRVVGERLSQAEPAWFGIVGPPKTSAAIAEKVAAGVAEALKNPDVLKRLGEMSAEPMGLRPAQTAAFMKEETERWAAVIRSAGVTLD